ncbi:HAMP domain-containing sensor histidine kinase [Vagococcus xieshaowenii]|uniref:Signal transduction histidine-protein kinase ArlS n=1 Tax=Vagococcus xieshaowenii TaxID=2562451 RepID=A0A4Z0DD54_9ENTE|nr:HAMP domain-containing histidine kinase [Vagococcus xieshaowenii]QCA28392.1 HAMP domain-containing histidine kinase [Vagococcus xieshaowenii]TFZ42852.1 HAMP domain-containing histidine kinase [Vagococcus xieshaowenii]
MTKEKNNEKKVHFHLSMSGKWTLLTSLFVLISVIVFSTITYKKSIDTLIEVERKNINETLKDVSSRLKISNNELSIRNTAYYLSNDNNTLGSDPTERTLEANLIRLNSFISELSQPELSVSVYNSEQSLVFETRNTRHAYFGSDKQEVSQKIVDGKTGFLATEPIYSKQKGQKIGYVQLFYDLSQIDSVKENLITLMLWLSLFSIIISLLFGFILSNYFMRPLKKITDVINEIKADPQTEARMPVEEMKDEFADLGIIFNDMMDRMQRFIEQQQQFVGDVSHELRTPVAVIEGHLKLLDRWGKDDPEILEESLSASLQEISRMKSLVQEMLDLSRAGQIDLHHKNDVSNAKEVIHQVYNNFVMLYPDFKFVLDDDIIQEKQVRIYRNHLEQILIIILDNAVKYSLNRKEILLSISTSHEYLQIAIQDYGEGISEADLEQVFNRFYRVDKARSRHKGGNGLGLSIAKQLVETYEGDIVVESILEKGSVFRISLPLAKEE